MKYFQNPDILYLLFLGKLKCGGELLARGK